MNEEAPGAQEAGIATAAVGERSRVRVGLVAFAGSDMLLASWLIDRLERAEGDVGLAALNLIFATLIATIVVCTAALVGDSLLALAERRMGRRPGARLVTPLLALCGATASVGILIDHVDHPLALDSWVGLAGSVLLAIAAVAHHHLPHASRPPGR